MRAHALKGKRILVVEDEAAVSLMLEDLLTDAGATVVGPAVDAAEALALIRPVGTIDCAVLDYRLAVGTSAAVADTLMERGVPFVFASGYDPNAVLPKFAHVPRLNKVFDNRDLIEAVGRLVASANPS